MALRFQAGRGEVPRGQTLCVRFQVLSLLPVSEFDQLLRVRPRLDRRRVNGPGLGGLPADFFGPCLATQSKRPIICKMNELSKARATMLEVGEESVGQRIDNFLIRNLKGVPKSHVYRILRSGEVRVNSGRIKPDYRLVDGDKVRVPPVRVATPEAFPEGAEEPGNPVPRRTGASDP